MTNVNSQINNVLSLLSGTAEFDILVKTEEMYAKISNAQAKWYSESAFTCPSGCGECCRHFEPDLLECESLYLAAWLIENQYDTALKIIDGEFPFDNGKACLLFNPNSDYHCSVYNERAFICRLFGASGFKNKEGSLTWKPCKFYPIELLQKHTPPIKHVQYSKEETLALFGTIPPIMSDLTEESLSICGNSTKTYLMRDILPKTISKLLWIIDMSKAV